MRKHMLLSLLMFFSLVSGSVIADELPKNVFNLIERAAKPPFPSWAIASRACTIPGALRDSKTAIAVFVDCPGRLIKGVLPCIEKKLPDVDGPAILVAVPANGWFYYYELPPTATDQQIFATIRRAREAMEPKAAPVQLLIQGGGSC